MRTTALQAYGAGGAEMGCLSEIAGCRVREGALERWGLTILR